MYTQFVLQIYDIGIRTYFMSQCKSDIYNDNLIGLMEKLNIIFVPISNEFKGKHWTVFNIGKWCFIWIRF